MIKVADHAYKQSKKRMSWSKSATKRMAEKAFTEGSDVSSDDANKCMYLNDIVYVFRDRCLITLYRSGRNINGMMQNKQI